MKLRVCFVFAVVCLLAATVCLAQDPVKVDPKHYTVVSENADVRILRIHYGPHEKSVMHTHPASVVVYLTDSTGKMTTPDGKTTTSSAKAGQAMYVGPTTHMPENATDKPFELIQVELKNPKAVAAAKK